MIALPEIKFKESKLSHKNSFNELEKESSLDMLQYIKKQPLNRLRSIQKNKLRSERTGNNFRSEV